MLGQRIPQTSIFEGDQLYLTHVGAHTFYGYLARHRHELFRDEDFAALYSPNWGRPSVPPSLLCLALLLQTYEGCSDAEARDRAAFDLRWKVALGVPDSEKPFTKSTLQLFRAQLLLHDQLRLPFERSLALARKSGYLKSQGKMRAAVDTTPILGRGAVKDTYNLIADGIVAVMRRLAKGTGKTLEQWAEDHSLGTYLASSLKGQVAIDWSNEAEKEALLGTLVADANRVLEMARQRRASLPAGGATDEKLLKACEILVQVLLQDVERPESTDDQGMKIRQGTSAERICSVHDPEIRHGRKSSQTRFDGHKLAIVADVETQLVTAVEVMAGSAKDDQGSLELVQRSVAHTGLAIETVLGDCAYGSGPNRERFAEMGIELQAKVPRLNHGAYFTKDDFEIDLVTMSCRCPAGQVTTQLGYGAMQKRAGRTLQMRVFRFSPVLCRGCPLRTRCYKPGRHGRVISLHPQEATMQAAKAWQRSPEFVHFRKQRQVVEHRLARMVQLGVRQARYFGRRKTLFQVLMAATIANLTLILGKTKGLGGPDGASCGAYRVLRARLTPFVPSLKAMRRLFSDLRRSLAVAINLRDIPALVLRMASFRPDF